MNSIGEVHELIDAKKELCFYPQNRVIYHSEKEHKNIDIKTFMTPHS